ncbi:hypothetical protein [Rhizobium fabae]|uniref:Uncharacterized protein n=1 Tax=Rhizobium fabae TaxID=573179 RepID=A0A7W6FJ66_9HYPH|nr:hypothetical protein [Rhizobium fabae]MBB3915559.1 hypothetical protein [Rhizobium fabae]RUM11859.1 hypothetical protein EFB14_15840 [Rhizobium fabae]
MPTPDIELQIFTGYTDKGPSGPFAFSAAKFVDELDRDQIQRLAAIDAELAALLASADMDKAQMQVLIGEVLAMLGM